MDSFLNCLVKDLRSPSLCRLWQGSKSRSWTTLIRQPDIRTTNLTMQPCLKVISLDTRLVSSLTCRVLLGSVLDCRNTDPWKKDIAHTAANDGSRQLAFMHFFARSLCSPHCILPALVNCVVSTRCDISILSVSFLVSLCN